MRESSSAVSDSSETKALLVFCDRCTVQNTEADLYNSNAIRAGAV